jgi:CheY-like chemotaxis protein
MAMFGLKKDKPSGDSELSLAYLEEVQRMRVPLSMEDSRGRALISLLTTVADDKIALSTQGLHFEKGTAVSLVFVLEGLRFNVSTKVLESKPGSAVVGPPTGIALAERRKRPRGRLNAREGATAIALTGLFDGVGVNGNIDNVSEGGFCIRVDRVMEVKTQRKMAMSVSLLPVGTPLMLVKLNKLPKCPTLELSGKVAWIDSTQGLMLGITFDSGKEPLLGPVRSLVSSRASDIPTSVPPRTRRPPENAKEPEAAAPNAAPKKEAEAPAAPVAAPKPMAAAPPPPPEPEAAPPVDERARALLRVKKRTRGILLAMPEGPGRDRTAARLAEDGYGRVICAGTLTDLLEHMDRPGVNLVLVDGGVAELQGLALASLMAHRFDDHLPPVILAEETVDADLVLGARESGVAQILIKPYDLDPDFLRMIEEHLGIG